MPKRSKSCSCSSMPPAHHGMGLRHHSRRKGGNILSDIGHVLGLGINMPGGRGIKFAGTGSHHKRKGGHVKRRRGGSILDLAEALL